MNEEGDADEETGVGDVELFREEEEENGMDVS
jgi:hypothetical protein